MPSSFNSSTGVTVVAEESTSNLAPESVAKVINKLPKTPSHAPIELPASVIQVNAQVTQEWADSSNPASPRASSSSRLKPQIEIRLPKSPIALGIGLQQESALPSMEDLTQLDDPQGRNSPEIE